MGCSGSQPGCCKHKWPATDPPLCPVWPKPLQDLPRHPGPGSWNLDLLLVFPAQSWNDVRVMVQAGVFNKHKAKAGCWVSWSVGWGGTWRLWGCKDSSEGLQGGESWILPRVHRTHKVGLKQILLLITADDTLGLSRRPPLSPLCSHNCALSVTLGNRAWGQDKDYATLQHRWTTTATLWGISRSNHFSKQGKAHTKTHLLIKVSPIMTFFWYCVQNPPLEKDYMQSMPSQTPLKC